VLWFIILFMADTINIALYVLLFFSLYAQVFMLVTFFEMRERRRKEALAPAKQGSANPTPSVAVIVPCYNEEVTVGPTITSILSLEYPSDLLEVVVVDDGSTDATRAAVEPFLTSGRVRYLYKENGGKHSALNMALERIQSDLVACLDADSFVAPDALRRLVAVFKDPSIMAATSFIFVHEPKTLMQRIQSAEYVVSGLLRDILGYMNALFVTPGPFSIYRRSIFARIGGFREGHLTEDLEMALRMQTHGMRIVNVPTSRVATVAPATFKALLRQRVRWHYGFLNNAREYRRLFFRPAYGNLGFFSLPAAVISIFASIFFTVNMAKDFLLQIWTKIVEITTIGFSIGTPSFDWFFLRTEPYNLLLISVMLIFLLLVVAARTGVGDRKGLALNTVYFFFLYGLIAPIWYAYALSRVVFSGQVRWK
jgi:cellulose synthase/poly-beta-1,6-N-acetylglucosamine synthase-like glycosyltransferase